VNEIRQQRDAPAGDEHDRLRTRGETEDRERAGDRADAVARTLDLVVDQAVGMAVLRGHVPRRRMRRDGLRQSRRRQVAMPSAVAMAVHAVAVAMQRYGPRRHEASVAHARRRRNAPGSSPPAPPCRRRTAIGRILPFSGMPASTASDV
jgi:hypothetical protein